MSVVTTAVLIADYVPEAVAAALKEGYRDLGNRLVNFDRDVCDVPVEWTTGSKVPGGSVFIGGFNHLRGDEAVAWLRSLPWTAGAVLVLHHEFGSIHVHTIHSVEPSFMDHGSPVVYAEATS